MLHLTYSNRTEALLARLVARLDARRRRGDDPLEPVWLVVPNKNVERYVELGLARGLGIAANLRFERLGGLARAWLGERVLIGEPLTARVLRALLDDGLLASPPLAPVRRYLGGGGAETDAVDLRRAQLAVHVAHLLEEYAFSRPDLLEAWDAGAARFARTEHGPTEAWQRALYLYARAHPASAGWRTLREALAQAGPPPAAELHAFGLSYVAPIFAELFATLGERAELHLYTLNPCEEFWEDVETRGELRRRRRGSPAEPAWSLDEEDPFGLTVDTETPLLRLFGRPGREHVRLLDALTECDFDPAFVDPLDPADAPAPDAGMPLFATLARPSLLARLQHDVLVRAPAHPAGAAPRTDSLRVLACPSVRREVETVAAEIWRAIEELDGLTFDQIAVLVNGPDRDLYLPHVAAVFEEARGIPFNVVDLTLASVSPVVEAALRLLALPAGRFARPEVLGVITHPAVRPAEVDPHAWAALVDRLGIFHGIDHAAHEGTYVGDRELLSWEQGLTRIALGAFLSSEGVEAPFVDLAGRAFLPEDAPLGDRDAARLGQLVRSLASDVAFLREARLSLTRWARLLSALLRAYVQPRDGRDETALRRALSGVEGLAALDLDGAEVSYPIAQELARAALESLAGGRGQQLADGVAVSSLMPMRAIPFRVIFVLGLGEGRFPAPDRRDSLDLRAARRRAGDVTAPERDRYTFLETMLSARDRLVLSYVGWDERTGDALSPSTVVAELLEVIGRGYLSDVGAIVTHPRLRRHEEDELGAVLPAALAERTAHRLGTALRESLAAEGREALLDPLDAAEIARRAAADEPLRRALGLAPLPTRAAAAPAEGTLRLSLVALRRFLECPLQGWTQVVLGLADDELDSDEARADEPFAAGALEATATLRGAFAASVLSGRPVAEAYAARARALEARGRWPLGALAEIEAQRHAEVLARWRVGWDGLASAGTGSGEAGADGLGGAAPVGRLRLGPAMSRDPSEEVVDPIAIGFADDPRRPGSGRPLRVELAGQSELLRASPRASVILLTRLAPGERGRIDALRHALRAFFDHAALAAIGRPGPHRAVLLRGDSDEPPTVLRFRPVSPEAARGWLGALAYDLLSAPHPYLFPVEAALRLADRVEDARGEELVASVERVRDQWDGGQSRWGPVREPLRHAPPDPGRAEEIFERRFGLPLRSLEVS